MIELVRKKDRIGFKTLVDTWQDMVYNTALGVLQNAEDAEDVSQEVFMKVYDSISSFKGESKFSTWFIALPFQRQQIISGGKKEKNDSLLFKACMAKMKRQS